MAHKTGKYPKGITKTTIVKKGNSAKKMSRKKRKK